MKRQPWLERYDAGVPHTMAYPAAAVHELLEQAAEKYGEHVCTIYKGSKLSYAVLNGLSDGFAAALLQLGLAKGERVAVMMPNVPQFVIAYYGILKAGGVVVAMNPQYKADELLFQMQASEAKMVVALRAFQPVLESIRAQFTGCQFIYSSLEDALVLAELAAGKEMQINDSLSEFDHSSFLKILRDHLGHKPEGYRARPDDPAIFQFSGGTTGIPKAAIGLHRNLVANIYQFRHWLVGLEDGREMVLAAIPLFHVYGMVIAMGMAVALGAGMILIDNARDIDAILQSIDSYHATLFPGVPNLYQAINRHPDVEAGYYNLSSIKGCISGSAPLMRTTKEKFESLTGGKLIEGYGLSEAPTATHCNPMYGENREGSIGLPIPDVDCRIVDMETGLQEKPVGEAGELILCGPQVMAGYYQNDEETRQTLRDGWLFTGDIARMDTEGYFYLVGRKKDLIKIGGFQVWPREIEEVLEKHPAVADVCVAGVPDIERSEVVKAWVILKNQQEASSDELQEWCRERIADYKCPTLIAFRQNFPRTSVGKLLRRELIREHIEGMASDVS
jgi:long-chain acyl-CoA synthetase